jgi:hypothetical protein
MRPVSFTDASRPSLDRLPRIGARAFRHRLSYVDGLPASVTVVVTRSACEFAGAYPYDVDPAVLRAVESDGRTVIRSFVLDRQRPPPPWIVHAEGIFPAPQPA